MNKYDRTMLHFDIALLILGIANISWAIAKAALGKWQLSFSYTTVGVTVAFAVGVFFIIFAARDLIRYKQHGAIEHGFDERNVKIIGKAWRNATGVFTVLIYVVIMLYELFHAPTEPVFSTRFLSYLLIPPFLVLAVSWWHYERSRNI